jgi:tetratricopeptide (TPR) repeat protein
MVNSANLGGESIHQLIREARLHRGLTQHQLVAPHYSVAYLSQVEQGRVLPSMEFLDFLAEQLNLNLEQLHKQLKTIKYFSGRKSREKIEMHLMNAHIVLQMNQPENALAFLKELENNQIPLDLLARYHSIFGETELKLKNYQAALEHLNIAIELRSAEPIINEADQILELERVRNHIGQVYYLTENYPRAREEHLKCLDAISKGKITDRRFTMYIYANLGNENHILSENEQAVKYYREAASLAERNEDNQSLAGIYWGLGLAYRGLNNPALSKLYLLRSAELFEQLQEWNSVVILRSMVGRAQAEDGEIEEALETLLKAIGLAKYCRDTDSMINARLNLAYCYHLNREYEKALEQAELAIQSVQNTTRNHIIGQILAQLADEYLALGREEEGFAKYREAINVLKESGEIEIYHRVLKRYADALKGKYKLQEAFEVYRSAYLSFIK